MNTQPDLSVIIVSYKTPDLIRRCLDAVYANAGPLQLETFVVDNASNDGTVEMIRREYPQVHVIPLSRNAGFGAANNAAISKAIGRYWLLLNSDAFIHAGALESAVRHMEEEVSAGVGGARLTGIDGDWQPSACMFPSPLNDILLLSGLSARFPNSHFFTRMNRRWADPAEPAEPDWVPGAFMILRPEAMRRAGLFFDESFFLYYEEVDLCRRVKQAGYRVFYWPDIRVTHLGGESARRAQPEQITATGRQLALWRFRSEWIYYRKHHRLAAGWIARLLESSWYRIRELRNRCSFDPMRRVKAGESRQMARLLAQAWRETHRGRQPFFGTTPAP